MPTLGFLLTEAKSLTLSALPLLKKLPQQASTHRNMQGERWSEWSWTSWRSSQDNPDFFSLFNFSIQLLKLGAYMQYIFMIQIFPMQKLKDPTLLECPIVAISPIAISPFLFQVPISTDSEATHVRIRIHGFPQSIAFGSMEPVRGAALALELMSLIAVAQIPKQIRNLPFPDVFFRWFWFGWRASVLPTRSSKCKFETPVMCEGCTPVTWDGHRLWHRFHRFGSCLRWCPELSEKKRHRRLKTGKLSHLATQLWHTWPGRWPQRQKLPIFHLICSRLPLCHSDPNKGFVPRGPNGGRAGRMVTDFGAWNVQKCSSRIEALFHWCFGQSWSICLAFFDSVTFDQVDPKAPRLTSFSECEIVEDVSWTRAHRRQFHFKFGVLSHWSSLF